MFIHLSLCRLRQHPDPNPNDTPTCLHSVVCVSQSRRASAARAVLSIHTSAAQTNFTVKKGNIDVSGEGVAFLKTLA